MLSIDYTVTVPHPMGAKKVVRTREWHINDKCPQAQIEDFEGESIAESLEVASVYADGHELDYIKNHFKNIPLPDDSHRTCIWRGDFARFIFDNLTL